MRLFVLLSMLLVATLATAQKRILVTDKVDVKDSIRLRGKSVAEISRDSQFLSPTHFRLPTQKAVRDYVNTALGNVDVDSLVKAATASGFLTPNTIPYVDGNGRLNSRGFEEFGSLGSSPSAPSNGFRFFADASGRPSWRRADGFTRTFDASTISGNRVYTLQDFTGTLAMLEAGQTWTGVNTFAPTGSGGSGFTVQGTARFSMPVPVATDAQIGALTGNVLGGWMVSSTQNRPYFHNGSSYLGVMLGPQGGVPVGRIAHGDASGNIVSNVNFRWENNRLLIGNPTYDATQPWGFGISSVIRAPSGYSLQLLGEGHDGFFGMRAEGNGIVGLRPSGGSIAFTVRASGGIGDHTVAVDRSANPGPLSTPLSTYIDRTILSITSTSVTNPWVSFGSSVTIAPTAGQTYRQNYTFVRGIIGGNAPGDHHGFVFYPNSYSTNNHLLEGAGKVLITGALAGVGIGMNSINPSSAIEISRTNAGIVPARVTTAQRDAIGVGVASIAIGAGGSGYVNPPLVVISGGGGSGATAYSVVSGGVVTSVVMVNLGSGYTSAPTISFDTRLGPGSGATATATLSSPVRANGLSVLNTDLNRYQYWSTTLNSWITEASTIDVKRDTSYKVVNGNLDLSAQTAFFKNNYHTVRITTVVTAAATGNNVITMPVPTVGLLGISFKIAVEDTSGDGDISQITFGVDGSGDGYNYNGDGTYQSSFNLFPGVGVYLSVAWCEAKSAYRWVLQ